MPPDGGRNWRWRPRKDNIGSVTTDMQDFLGIEPTERAEQWKLPVRLDICGGRDSIYGGCGLAAAIEAAESVTGRPLAWASCQFLRPAHAGQTIDLDVQIKAEGRAVSHGRVIATVDGQEVFATMVSLGERDFPAKGVWQEMPNVIAPEQCPPRYIRAENKGGLREQIEERAVTTDPSGIIRSEDGRSAVWARLPGGLPAAASALAVLGDAVSTGLSAVLDPDAQAPSIDNTIRVVAPKACDWILSDVEIRAVGRGLAHGVINMWSPDGDLLAVTAQTGVVRIRGT